MAENKVTPPVQPKDETPKPTLGQTRDALKAQIASLDELERKTVTGAPVLTPKAMLLDARDVEVQHPEYRYRWVNTKFPDRVSTRKAEGYEIVPDSEGGKRMGDEMALARIPRPEYQSRVKRIEKTNQDRLEAHKVEFQRAVESVARELRDQHGLKDTTLERLLKD